ncbi:H+/gluconate symporter-like permease [Curtobacterium luteum]|uniref:H+/gluconate symporter-like permease n=1 Tax=Curtobacterium luteum TaxID=33881 RepID=A0A8H9L206_9MICO|nr:hypothetical protein [Curtobacterium luteum]MBM7803660.1 H+/gluconate symporter-like permease [Curtobacterium luteum]NUU49966.1 hypothetical protein [Curtobacterium luteum]GGK98780.1 hypothetical protein GCM10009769_16250 [Curtobacterium luteum]
MTAAALASVVSAAGTASPTPLPSPVPAAGATSAQATATLIAAIIAGAAALTAAVIGLINASRSLTQIRREQWRQQFQWAIEKALSHDVDESNVDLAVLTKLVQQPEAHEEDNEIALVVADLVTDRTTQPC